MQITSNLRIKAEKQLLSPEELLQELPLSETASNTVANTRQSIQSLVHGKDDRLLVIAGPCSIHDTQAALEYAQRLQPIQQELADKILIVMRVYFEKPRTTVGWKGLINDPGLDNSYRINDGLRIARQLLLDLNNMRMPAATEYLDLISPQYIADLVSWGAIGARTTESQCHRELASGLSCPVGFKNGTGGNIQIAVDAVASAARSHQFLSVTKEGRSAIFETSGNADCHVILRGGSRHPNYDPESIAETANLLHKAGLPPRFIIDCSHANSGKDHERQVTVCQDLAGQISKGNKNIMGLMLESNLVAGSQKQIPGATLAYGQSITDACMGWSDTKKLLTELAEAVTQRRANTE
jgi:3-deoxy-7-phosphoheptulonate synthase